MVLKNFNYTYKAFGLTICSQFPVTGFLPIPTDISYDVFIETGRVPRSLHEISNKGVLYQANTSEFLMHLESIGSFYVKQGKKIVVEKNKETDWEDINVFLIGRIFGALLHQRKLLTLHASALRYKGTIMVFAGHSGSGKSTLAAAFLERGAELLSDDIAAIDIYEDQPVIIPSFPLIKLWDDSLECLGKKNSDFRMIRKGYRKYYVPVDLFLNKPCVPEKIVILHSHNKDKFESKVLSGIEKFTALRNQSYFMRSIVRTNAEGIHFELCNKVARETSIIKLARPNGPIRINQLADHIESITGI